MRVHTAPMKETYEVYESNLAGLVKRLTALSLRSIKLGGTPILIEVGAPKDIAHPTNPNRTVRVFSVTVEGSAPKFAGWSFLATLAHTPDGNVVRSVPGFEVDAKVREGLPCCDHCKTARNRRDTYVVRHEDGRIMQVGSTCMKDFLGHADPHALTTQAELLLHAFDLVRNSGGTGMNEVFRFNTLAFLEWVAAVVLKQGCYVTRKVANESGRQATADIAYNAMMHMDRLKEESVYTPTNEAKALALSARNLVISKFAPVLLEDGSDDALKNSMLNNLCGANKTASDFEHNLLTCAKSEGIEPRLMGVAAYIVEYYRNEKNLHVAHRATQLDENFTRIFDMFMKAGEKLKHPTVRLADAQRNTLALSLAGAASKNAGWVYVKRSTGFDAAYYGKISPTGTFMPVASCPPTVKAQLAEFAKNPEAVASQYGKLTGCCCFCGRGLNDERSTDVGYGPVCASKFGLDWGKKAEAAAA